MTFERQVADAPFFTPNDDISMLRDRFPSPPMLCRQDEVFASLMMDPLELNEMQELFRKRLWEIEAAAYDDEWWNQDEEDWDDYDSSSSVLDYAYDHLTEKEYKEYLFDRSMEL